MRAIMVGLILVVMVVVAAFASQGEPMVCPIDDVEFCEGVWLRYYLPTVYAEMGVTVPDDITPVIGEAAIYEPTVTPSPVPGRFGAAVNNPFSQTGYNPFKR